MKSNIVGPRWIEILIREIYSPGSILQTREEIFKAPLFGENKEANQAIFDQLVAETEQYIVDVQLGNSIQSNIAGST